MFADEKVLSEKSYGIMQGLVDFLGKGAWDTSEESPWSLEKNEPLFALRVTLIVIKRNLD